MLYSKAILTRLSALLLFIASFHTISATVGTHITAVGEKWPLPPELGKGCSINLKSDVHKDYPPMIISLSQNQSSYYYYPTTADPMNLRISKNEKIGIFCPGKTDRKSSRVIEAAGILHKNSVLKEVEKVEPIVCESGKNFNVAGRTVDFTDLHCEEKSHASYSAILRRHTVEADCLNGNRYEIGYKIGSEFLRTIELCHNEKEAKTLWAHAVIEPANRNANRFSGDRQSFKTALLYADMQWSKVDPYSLNSIYKTVKSILGDEGALSEYLSNKTSDRKYLARGHLIASADKLYKSEQDSTMFYANVVPMWQQVNAIPGNWFLVEEYARHLAFHKDSKLDVWAGGIGVLKLKGKAIHLYRREMKNGLELRIPVPKVLYKCVVDKPKREALCFLVVNNPYAGKAEVEKDKKKSDYRVCKKLETCDKITPHFDEASLGYFYCCELKDFYTKNRKELGLEDLKAYAGYAKMTLLTNDKLHEAIPWSNKDRRRGEGKRSF